MTCELQVYYTILIIPICSRYAHTMTKSFDTRHRRASRATCHDIIIYYYSIPIGRKKTNIEGYLGTRNSDKIFQVGLSVENLSCNL